MSDFFSGIYSGIRRPDVVMNDGPLPPLTIGGGYPAGFNGTPDGQINYATSLLGDLNPYAYGEAARLSTQTAYMNIPHVCQRVIASLDLPEAQPYKMGGTFFRLSHQVDDGDLAFVIRAMFSPYELVSEKKKYNKQGVLWAVDPVVNLATVNYILHGLQRYGFDKDNHKCWNTLWIALGIDEHFQFIATAFGDGRRFSEQLKSAHQRLEELNKKGDRNGDEAMLRVYYMLKVRTMRRRLVDYLVKHVIKPFGIPRGSEKQGGQHQGSNSPVTWPVDFVTAMVVDGKVINLCNFWKHDDINSGDDLLLYVEDRPCTEYVLSHHPKCMKKQVFPLLSSWELPASLAGYGEDGHVSNEGEDLVRRLWDLFSEIGTNTPDAVVENARLTHVGRNNNNNAPPAASFDRRTMSAADLRSMWDNQEAMRSAIDAGGAGYHRYANPAEGMPKNYKGGPRQDRPPLEPTPGEAIFALQHLLFEYADAGVITDFLAAVASFRDRYKVRAAAAVSELLAMRAPGNASGPDEKEIWRSRMRDYDNARRVDRGGAPVLVKESVFQLVPGVSSSWTSGVKQAVWRHGYWHVARSQVMHFRYDQNVELFNGIHAAVRGKLLEATFAPMWVEPLEVTVMGSGAGGGGGVTSAQSFAYQGLGGNPHKRQKMIYIPGTSSMSLSRLASAYEALILDMQQFLHRVGAMSREMNLAYGNAAPRVVLNDRTRSEVHAGLQVFMDLCKRERALAATNLPPPSNPAVERERELIRRVDAMRARATELAVGVAALPGDPTYAIPGRAVNEFLVLYLLHHLIPSERVYEPSLFRSIQAASQAYVHGILCDRAAAAPAPRGMISAGELADASVSADRLERWRGRGMSVLGMWLASTICNRGWIDWRQATEQFSKLDNQADAIGVNQIHTGIATDDTAIALYERFAMGMFANVNDFSADTVLKTSICATALLVLDSRLHKISLTAATDPDRNASMRGNVAAIIEATYQNIGAHANAGAAAVNFQGTAIVGGALAQAFPFVAANYYVAVNECINYVFDRNFQVHQCPVVDMCGAYMGSIFASCINYLAYTGRVRNPGEAASGGETVLPEAYDAWDVVATDPAVGWGADMGALRVDPPMFWKSRICMSVMARHMIKAGVMMSRRIPVEHVADNSISHRMGVALYLLHLNGMDILMEAVDISPCTNALQAAAVRVRVEAVNLPLERMCDTALRGYERLVEFSATGAAWDEAGITGSIWDRLYDAVEAAVAGRYVLRKLLSTVSYYDNSTAGAAWVPRNPGYEEVETSFGHGQPVIRMLYAMLQVEGKTESVIFEALRQSDFAGTDANIASYTFTQGPIGGGGGGGEGRLHASHQHEGGDMSGVDLTPVDASVGNASSTASAARTARGTSGSKASASADAQSLPDIMMQKSQARVQELGGSDPRADEPVEASSSSSSSSSSGKGSGKKDGKKGSAEPPQQAQEEPSQSTFKRISARLIPS